MELSKEELTNISGGVSKYAIATIIGGVISFLIGLVDGYYRPLKCR